MNLARPLWLALVWGAPAVLTLYWWGHRRRRRILAAYAAPATRSRIAPGASPARRWARAGLLAATVLFVALAAVGPRYGFHWKKTERRGVDLIVAVDGSRSMLAQDVKPSRLARAKREVVDLLNRLEGDRVGLVAFAGTAFLQCPLTLDYEGLHLFLKALSPDYLPVGGTALAQAIQVAQGSFDPESAADRAILVISDGEETSGKALEAAEKAREAGIRVYVLGVGTPEGAPIPAKGGGFVKDRSGSIVLARLGEDALGKLADATGGAYARSVPGDEDLEALYDQRIRADLEARTLEAQKVKVWEDRYRWPLVLAVLALVLELALPPGQTAVMGLALVVALGAAPARAASPGAAVRQGVERYEAGDYKGAEKAFVEAQVADPANPEIAFDVGNAQYKAGRYDEAERSYTGALHGASDDLAGAILYNRGNARFRQGKIEEAIRDYEGAIEHDPLDENARLNLAFARKRLEARKKQPPPESKGQDGEKNKGDDKKQPQQGKDESAQQPSPEDQEGSHPGDQTGGEEKKAGPQTPGDEPEGTGKEPPEPAGAGQDESKQPGAPRSEAAQSGNENPGDEAGRQRARALLNRLEDQPGKALMPRYEKRRVEKNW